MLPYTYIHIYYIVIYCIQFSRTNYGTHLQIIILDTKDNKK